jgi:PilZ domain-containing protein
MPDKNVEMLREAIDRNSWAVFSLPSAGMLRNHKSRFVGESEGGILMQSPEGEAALIAELVRTQTPCAISFQRGAHKAIFASRVRKTVSEWRMNDNLAVDAVLLDFPTEIKSTQKRSDYRVEVQPDSDLSVRVWKISGNDYIKAKPSGTREVTAQIRNLSIGGVGVKLVGKDNQLPVIGTDDRLRVELNYQGNELVVEGRMRAPTIKPQGNCIVTGIQFKKMEENLEGRQTMAQLVRIVGELQRAELRMIKLGLIRSA